MKTTQKEVSWMDITKLPKWAQQHIKELEMSKKFLERALTEKVNCESSTPWSTTDIVSGVSTMFVTRYHDLGNNLKVKHNKINLGVTLNTDGSIGISFSSWNGRCYILPVASNCINIVNEVQPNEAN